MRLLGTSRTFQWSGRQRVSPQHSSLLKQVAEGELVVTRYRVEGTHLGPFRSIAATGKYGTITGIDIYRIADGQIEEAWSNWDTLRLLQQMDVIPPMQ